MMNSKALMWTYSLEQGLVRVAPLMTRRDQASRTKTGRPNSRHHRQQNWHRPETTSDNLEEQSSRVVHPTGLSCL